MDIRKISIGPDYKGSAMHYIVGQEILGSKYTIHLIKFYPENESIKIWIQQEERCFSGRYQKGGRENSEQSSQDVVTRSVVSGIITRIDLLEFVTSSNGGNDSHESDR